MFIENAAHTQGGAIFVIHSSIVADNFSTLLILNNFAFQGGALSFVPSSFTVEVRYHSSIRFINNTAHDVGGAVYADVQPAAPCLFMVTDYSSGQLRQDQMVSIQCHHQNGQTCWYKS